MMQNVSAILEKILDSGLAINGQISLNGLTITSTDKAKSLGILPDKPDQSDQKDEKQSSSDGGNQQSQSSGSEQGSQEGGQESQQSSPSEEIKNLKEEIRYIRTLIESSQNQQDDSKQKPRSQSR